jgi:Protein of unknown function (DUF1217)
MTFTPILPQSGFAGWAFLKRTMVAQRATHAATAALKRDEDYFRAKIGAINTAEELVKDKRLLRVALTAYGLEGDVNNTYFIKKVLSDGTLTTGALTNKLADKQYQKFSAAFGFGDFKTPRNKLSDFADKTLALYQTRQFEAAVGTQSTDMRLALNIERELPVLAKKAVSEDSMWYAVMGNTAMRKVFEQALSLPASFGAIDLDRQLSTLKAKTNSMFGSPSVKQFSDPVQLEQLVRRFLLRSDENVASTTTRGAMALQLLQAGG